MRGTLDETSGDRYELGIIPAHAGNTIVAKLKKYAWRDHPRACGEHYKSATIGGTETGSSPRMRGTPDQKLKKKQEDGIIPAHAGNTPPLGLEPRTHGDHPRACGEHSSAPSAVLSRSGSSPRMRGTPRHRGEEHVRRGIIPAHAGNTRAKRTGTPYRRDHPRACGEHITGNADDAVKAGSSPRMRGTLRARGGHLRGIGIIPAHAGNTGG